MLSRNGGLRILTPGWLILQLLLPNAAAQAAEVKPNWQVEWEKTAAEAKREGLVTLAGHSSSNIDAVILQFRKLYPEIKFDVRPGQFLQEAQRAMTERRAEKYLLDLFMTGPTTLFNIFYRAKALDPIKPQLLLPEVVDESKWFEGRHQYVDAERQYLFLFEGTAQSYVHYNTRLVRPNDLLSYWDLVKPQWRGKIVSEDPMVSGIVSHGTRFLYYNQELGSKFLTRLFGEMDVTPSRDRRQMLDWLASGKALICLFCYGVDEAKEQGLPVETVGPYNMKEGASIVPIQGALVLMNRAPHPNAARLFINWFLSRDGQAAYQKQRMLARGSADSLRIDIPKDDVPLDVRRRTTGKHLMATRPEWMDLAPAQKLIREARAQAKTK